MHPRWLALASALGFVAVAGGAFGAHALAARLPEDLLRVFETGATYARLHVAGLLAVAILARRGAGRAVEVAGWAFVVGVVLFTGSLWAMALSGARWLGAVTPVGGLGFLVGWAALGVAAFRQPALPGKDPGAG